jgi:signal transduction histidine kinase
MEQLVDQLLLLARADADAFWIQSSVVDLDDVVDTVVGPLLAEAPVVIDTSAVEPVQVPGDVRLLERAVVNLVQNACAHARHAVQVTLSRSTEGLAVLTVDDDGPGIPPDRRTDVFERFFRLDEPGYRNRDGVGLGLAIVAEIVTGHGGRVWACESPAGGARFTVELPTAHPPRPQGSGGSR